MTPKVLGPATCLACACVCISTARAQGERKAPVSDVEDARLSTVRVGEGRLHPVLGVDVRNGDFVRGVYDDDAAGLRRVPLHVQVGLAVELTRDAGGMPTSWLLARSSNGFHRPSDAERSGPRAWYESNNAIGAAARLGDGVDAAATYTVKTSPNDVSKTTHEMSVAVSMDRESGFGSLKPGFVATWRPKGGSGFYTQASLEPEWRVDVTGAESRLSLPVVVGVGWKGFYEPGSRQRVFGSAGLALETPLPLGDGRRWAIRLETVALVRDAQLRALGGPRADHATVVPYATLSLSYVE